MRVAGLSMDVDSVASHLEGYGFDRPADDGAVYRSAVPRALDLFERLGVRCTFFLIAEEAERHRDVVREIVRRGHEVGSHSMTHRLPFSDLDAGRTSEEVVGSKRLLEEMSGEVVSGFRAPSWDVGTDLLTALVEAGYRYDASSYPSLLLPVLRWSIARRSPAGGVRTGSSMWSGVFEPTGIHQRQVRGRTLVEVPICTVPWLRLPYYHTLHFALPSPVFRTLGFLARMRRAPISYQFHAVDFMEIGTDALDPRIGRHPGMDWTLDRKIAAAEGALRSLSRARRVVPLVEVAERVAGSTAQRRHLSATGSAQ